MTPWWSETAAAWFGGIGGGGGGSLCGVLGMLIGILAPRGIGRRVMIPLCVLCVGAGGIALVASLVALFSGQPYHVWFPLLLTGLVVTIVMSFMVALAVACYRRIDERKMQAEDLRRG